MLSFFYFSVFNDIEEVSVDPLTSLNYHILPTMNITILPYRVSPVVPQTVTHLNNGVCITTLS